METSLADEGLARATEASEQPDGVAVQGRQPTLLLRVKRRRDAAAPEEMILQQSSIKRSREDELAAQLAALMSDRSKGAASAAAAGSARRRCRFLRVRTVKEGAVLGRSANDLVQLMQAPEFQGKELPEVLQLLEHQEGTQQQQQQQQVLAQQLPSHSRTTFSAAAPLGAWDDAAHARPSYQPGVQYMQLPRQPVGMLAPGSSDAAPITVQPLQQQQGGFRLYDLVHLESKGVQEPLQLDQGGRQPAAASDRDSSSAGLAAGYESLLQEYLSTQQQQQQQQQQASTVAAPSPRLKPPGRRRQAQPNASALPAHAVADTDASSRAPAAVPAAAADAAPPMQQGQSGQDQAQQQSHQRLGRPHEDEYVYDVYLATEALWTEVLPVEGTAADEEGVPVVEVLNDEEELGAPAREAPDPDHDSEDSNAESFYANSYPDDEPYGHEVGTSDEEGEEGFFQSGGGRGGHGAARVPIYGNVDDEEFDAEEYEEEEFQAAMLPGQLWRSRLLQG